MTGHEIIAYVQSCAASWDVAVDCALSIEVGWGMLIFLAIAVVVAIILFAVIPLVFGRGISFIVKRWLGRY